MKPFNQMLNFESRIKILLLPILSLLMMSSVSNAGAPQGWIDAPVPDGFSFSI